MIHEAGYKTERGSDAQKQLEDTAMRLYAG